MIYDVIYLLLVLTEKMAFLNKLLHELYYILNVFFRKCDQILYGKLHFCAVLVKKIFFNESIYD